MDVSILLLVLIPGLIVVAAVGYAIYRADKRRAAAMRGVAGALGLRFHPWGGKQIIHDFSHLEMFRHGTRHLIRNLMTSAAEGLEMSVFDLEYGVSIGGMGQSKTRRGTVVAFRSPGVRLPDFSLRPAELGDKVSELFGEADIDFPTHPGFSRKYRLSGSDATAIREVFTDALLSLFEQHEALGVEAGKSTIIFYRTDGLIPPDRIPSFLEDCFAIYRLLGEQR